MYIYSYIYIYIYILPIVLPFVLHIVLPIALPVALPIVLPIVLPIGLPIAYWPVPAYWLSRKHSPQTFLGSIQACSSRCGAACIALVIPPE